MISIVIPLYNKENDIARCIRSILNQTFQDFEIFVVNDGSTDNSVTEVEKISDPRIRLINQQNGGVSVARNRGIREAKGNLVAFLDADDEWLPNFLETIERLRIKFPNCNVYGTNYSVRLPSGSMSETVLKGVKFKGTDGIIDNYFEVAAKSSPPICSICVAIRKNILQKIEGFPVGIKSGEDLLTWARCLIDSELAYCRTPHAIYNQGEAYNYSNEPVRRQDKGDPVGKELKKLLKDNPSVPGLRKYLSHWHKMRASVAIRFNERMETIRESISALKYNPLNMKVIPFIFLACLPSAIRKRIIALKKH